MSKLTKQTGGLDPPVALFDRVSGVNDVRASILAELERLLNSRTPDKPPLAGTLGTPAYGIPDLSTFSYANEGMSTRIIDRIERAIAYFEPRLRSARVHVEPKRGEPDRLDLVVQAQLRGSLEPFQTTLTLDRRR